MKKVLAILLAAMLMMSFAACRGADAPSEPADTGASTSTPGTDASTSTGGEDTPAADYKIGIITGTVSQGEEEFQAAQQMIEKYGADKIITATYPDKFNDEVETTISQVMGLAEQGAKAIVFCQAVPGAIASIEKCRETYPDMLFVTGVVQETPSEVSAVADVCMLVDEIGMGTTVIEQAAKMGAKTFIHYSFPRHLGMETIARRRELFMQTCEANGIEYVDVTAPDPTGDAGVSGAQQFIIEDVPRELEKYGKDTAFFSTNCSMQEPLIREVINNGGIYPQQCCPSPYHGFPAALNIETQGHEGDVQYMLDQIQAKVEEAGMTGRVSTWPLPVNMLMIEAGTDYAVRWCEGEFTDRFDDAEIRKSIAAVAKEYGATETLSLYDDNGTELENFYMILCTFYDF
ncbi:DUF3798 domain-containing protein [Clostridia bacterium OttesenSCG-928-O13]|nr:DUF3798 domain-containing protein [Clostridia bacterium OttesenSCG-928-O13]